MAGLFQQFRAQLRGEKLIGLTLIDQQGKRSRAVAISDTASHSAQASGSAPT